MYDIQKMTPTNKIEKPYLLAGVISYIIDYGETHRLLP